MKRYFGKILFVAFFLILLATVSKTYCQNAQEVYSINLDKPVPFILSGHLQLGSNRSPKGDVLDANSSYFIRNGHPWYPVMGEFHYSRYPHEMWEESILKMKAAGIDVVATYVFWLSHEEEEGKFDFSGSKNLREFIELCARHKVYAFVRIGPWCHGEVRNGGFPDWLAGNPSARKNNPEFLRLVKRYWTEVNNQMKGLYFKDGGPIIGIQIENEFRFNNAPGLEYMLALKKIAKETGIDVPYYTATGWPGSNQQQNELVPVWGAYPEAPWNNSLTQLPLSENYLFGPLRNDPSIGSDLLGKTDDNIIDYKGYRYPFATAEMGGGNQITYHRRPVIEAKDITALAYVKTGSGANLMGYYMFHGGSNPLGKFSTFQESKATKYPNDYPVISYDFYAPIGEWGQLRPSYREFKMFHMFLNNFGELLATYPSSFPDRRPASPKDNSTLRFSVRSDGQSGFVFVNNFQRQLEMKDLDIKFDLKLIDDERLKFPENSLTVKKGTQLILPFNMDISGANLKYATAQPLCTIKGNKLTYVFVSPEGVVPEFVFDNGNISNIEGKELLIVKKERSFVVTAASPGISSLAEITLNNGGKVKLLTLTCQEALNAWKSDVFGREYLFISEQDLFFSDNAIKIRSMANPNIEILSYPEVNGAVFDTYSALKKEEAGVFTRYLITLPPVKLKASFKALNECGKYIVRQKVAEDNKRTPVDITSPGPQYFTNFRPVDNSKQWLIELPGLSSKGINDAFMKIDYTGDTGSAYSDGVLIADDFYTGLPMTMGLKRFGLNPKPKEIVFQVVPLTEERKIYFEKGVRERATGKNSAGVRDVQLIPQYEVTMTR